MKICSGLELEASNFEGITFSHPALSIETAATVAWSPSLIAQSFASLCLDALENVFCMISDNQRLPTGISTPAVEHYSVLLMYQSKLKYHDLIVGESSACSALFRHSRTSTLRISYEYTIRSSCLRDFVMLPGTNEKASRSWHYIVERSWLAGVRILRGSWINLSITSAHFYKTNWGFYCENLV